jgi:uncharacterized protein
VSLVWDAWDPAYLRGGADDEGPTAESNASVDPDVERAEANWCALPPATGARCPDVVLFVDGVLRNDARGWFTDPSGAAHPALAASYAAGVVRCDLRGGAASLVASQVKRGLFTSGAGLSALGNEPARYPAFQVGGGLKQLDAQLRVEMGRLEVAVSEQARAAEDGEPLLIADGRLGLRRDLPHAIGCVKTQTGRYLPAHLVAVVTSLPPGHRSPVFGLSSLYSWYLRLPGAPAGPWSGIVRIECSAELSPQEAVELADLTSVTLPRFASSPYKDARAPQNLVPIAGLEKRLRAQLGDARLLHRTLLRAAVTP